MITFFTTAKPFTGHTGIIQQNALKSWTLTHPDAEVILFGDEEGAAETARGLGIRHVPAVERVAQGPKLLRSFFEPAQKMARNEIVCYANCDIVLTDDISTAVRRVAAQLSKFLMVGRRWDTNVTEAIDFENAEWKSYLREAARRQAEMQSGDWIDYFAFQKGLYLGELPDFVIGRVHWDQWLVWKAREMGAAVVDASEGVMAIHQNHDYGYHPAGKSGVWSDELSRKNYQLAGGRWHLRTIDDASHLLSASGVRENPRRRQQAIERIWRTVKQSAWLGAMEWTRPVRRATGLGGRKN
jgi:hypothetical protein